MRINESESIRTARLVVWGIIAVTAIVCGFLFLVVSAFAEKPKFIEPKVIVNGPKYYPRPYYPEKKVTKEVIERTQYEVLY